MVVFSHFSGFNGAFWVYPFFGIFGKKIFSRPTGHSKALVFALAKFAWARCKKTRFFKNRSELHRIFLDEEIGRSLRPPLLPKACFVRLGLRKMLLCGLKWPIECLFVLRSMHFLSCVFFGPGVQKIDFSEIVQNAQKSVFGRVPRHIGCFGAVRKKIFCTAPTWNVNGSVHFLP